MTNFVQVRRREQGKIITYNCEGIELNIGDTVIVEDERGVEYGVVVAEAEEASLLAKKEQIKKILRVANTKDMEQIEKNIEDTKRIYDTTMKKIEEHKLPMKLVYVEYSFDRTKLIFYFTAEERIDFRKLVKDLAYIFKVRIELIQIGVRDEAKMLGGLGPCGRELCCAEFLKDFVPVTIRMAKDQNLPLNPEKISGLCGRLMCCLTYEHKLYKEFSKGLPREGQIIQTKQGKGKVISVNPLKRLVVVELEEDERQIKIDYNEK
ncbi:MAG: stage 0 sporulation family protein [Candidatus Omnitrophota bacterium]